jgi:ABC-type multidrug transport system fused ATPase/permease subunit
MSMARQGRAPIDTGPKAKFSQLLPYLLEHKAALSIATLLSLIGAATSLAQPLVVGEIITAVSESREVTRIALILVGIILASGIASGFMYFVLAKAGEGVVLSARNKLAVRLLRLPILEYDTRRTGDLVSRVGSDTTLLRAVLTQGLIDAAGGALIFIGAIIAMLVIDPFLLLLTLAMISVAVIAIVFTARQIRSATTKAQQRVGDMAASVERALSAVRTIRAARAEIRETESIKANADQAYLQGVKIAKINALISPIAGIASNAAFIVVLGVGGYRVASGETSIANLVTFILLMFLMIRPLGQAFGAYSSVMSALGALARIEEIVSLPLETDGDQISKTKPSNSKSAIEFRKVSFSYPKQESDSKPTPVLDRVSFQIEPGSRVALVGPSGAGKSTIFSLIERFYEPGSGQILLQGVPISEMSRDQLRSQLGYVEQDAPVLAGTIRENLLIGNSSASDKELRKVLAAVNLTGVLKRDSRGLDAEVGEAGVMLSGGERQRLAIARALLAAPPILLLDESTSALDGLNEQRMREAIDAVSKGRTLIVIAHRLSTVVDSDQIIVLDQGKVVGSGSHSELVKSTPLYKELAKHQLLV